MGSKLSLRDLAGQRIGQLKQGSCVQRLEPLAIRAAFWDREPEFNTGP
jgi:hypothetical protein